MKKVFAIYDNDVLFVTRFMEFLKKRKGFDYEVIVFTRKDSFNDYITDNPIEILLIDKELYEEEPIGSNIGYVYRLSEERGTKKDSEHHTIYKYQSAQNLISEILSDYLRKEKLSEGNYSSNDPKLITIVSPIPNLESLSFAWSFSYILSEKYKSLFIPMELFPVTIFTLEDNINQSLSEFIYYLKDNNPNVIMKMKSLLRYTNNLAYLSGITHGFDLLSLGKEDVDRWLEELKTHLDFSTIIFYFNYYSETYLELIRQSNEILVPILNSPYQISMIKEWKRQMDLIGIHSDSGRIRDINLQEEVWSGQMINLQELCNRNSWLQAVQYLNNT